MLLSGLVGLLLLGSAIAVPATLPTKCKNQRIRKEWRTLGRDEKKAYINAVKCLHTKTGIYQDVAPGSLTKFEDLAWVHKDQSPYIHFVGHFHPWHRLLLWTMETQLRTHCGYTGAQPYWDYTLDANNLLASPLWDSTVGFGHNGPTLSPPTFPVPFPDAPPGIGGGCVPDGPFAFPEFKLHVDSGPNGTRVPDRCVARNMNPTIAARELTAEKVNKVLAQPNFDSMLRFGEGNFTWADGYGIHNSAHFAVGGENNNVWSSPLDPLFYVHHANLDRVWYRWQKAAPTTRTYEIGGPIKPWKILFDVDYSHLSDGPVTLDFEINLGRLQSAIPVAKVMDTNGDFLCYEYR